MYGGSGRELGAAAQWWAGMRGGMLSSISSDGERQGKGMCGRCVVGKTKNRLAMLQI